MAGDGEDSYAAALSRSSSPIETHTRLTLVCTEARKQFRNLIASPTLSKVYGSRLILDPVDTFFHEKINPSKFHYR